MPTHAKYVENNNLSGHTSEAVLPNDLNGGGTVKHVSAIFDGNNSAVKESRIKITDGDDVTGYPTCKEVKKGHGVDQYGSNLLNIIAYSSWGNTYGYYVVPNYEYDNSIDIEFENGSGNVTKYRGVVIFE